jgi:hypothetical protein
MATILLLYLVAVRRVSSSDASAIFVSELATDTLVGLTISTVAVRGIFFRKLVGSLTHRRHTWSLSASRFLFMLQPTAWRENGSRSRSFRGRHAPRCPPRSSKRSSHRSVECARLDVMFSIDTASWSRCSLPPASLPCFKRDNTCGRGSPRYSSRGPSTSPSR